MAITNVPQPADRTRGRVRPTPNAPTQADYGESPHALQMSPDGAGGDVSRPQRRSLQKPISATDARLARLLTRRAIERLQASKRQVRRGAP